MDDQVVIVAGFRTPIGSFNGSLASFKADELGSLVLKHIIDLTKTFPDDVIIGQSLTAAQGIRFDPKLILLHFFNSYLPKFQGQNPSRQTALNAGCPQSVTATTINMLCGSGLKAVALAYQSIKCGDAKVVVCGGQESMSRVNN